VDGACIDETRNALFKRNFRDVFRPFDVDLIDAVFVARANVDDSRKVNYGTVFFDDGLQKLSVRYVAAHDFHVFGALENGALAGKKHGFYNSVFLKHEFSDKVDA